MTAVWYLAGLSTLVLTGAAGVLLHVSNASRRDPWWNQTLEEVEQ